MNLIASLILVWYVTGAVCSIPVIISAKIIKNSYEIERTYEEQITQKHTEITCESNADIEFSERTGKHIADFSDLYVKKEELKNLMNSPDFYPNQIIEMDGKKSGYVGIYNGRRVIEMEDNYESE